MISRSKLQSIIGPTKPKTLLQALVRLRRLLDAPGAWTKQAEGKLRADCTLGRAGQGIIISTTNTRSRALSCGCFCMIGAAKVASGSHYTAVCNALRAELPGTGYSIADFNDDAKTSHRKVMGVINRAIKRVAKDAKKAAA